MKMTNKMIDLDPMMTKREFLKKGGVALSCAALSSMSTVASSMSHAKSMSEDQIVRMGLVEA